MASKSLTGKMETILRRNRKGVEDQKAKKVESFSEVDRTPVREQKQDWEGKKENANDK